MREKSQVYDKYIKLLEEKAALENKLKMVEKEVAELKNELTDVKMVNQRILSENESIISENNRNVSELQGMKMEWERSKVRGSVGAWLELARRQILQSCGQLKSDTSQAQTGQIWHNFVVVGIIKNGTPEEKTKFWNVVDTLFNLTKSEWEHLAAFYKSERCVDAHYRPPAEESLNLLDALPEKYLPKRAIFVRLIKKADENEIAADDSPCV